MAKKFPLHPKHPERICWGCDKYCPVDSLSCGNGSDRTQHPAELLGDMMECIKGLASEGIDIGTISVKGPTGEIA